MAIELRRTTFEGADASSTVGHVSFFIGEPGDGERSGQWIEGRVISDAPTMRSLALNQITVLHRARDLIDAEIARLTPIYRKAELSQ